MSFTIEDNIIEGLNGLGNKSKRVQNKATRTGSQLFAEVLKQNTPYEDQSDRSWKGQREMDKIKGTKSVFKHMRDDIQISGVDQFGHINVGFGKDTYWRVHFVQLGTINYGPNPFISKTVTDTQELYQTTVATVLKKELGL
ncbi:head-tail adaptor protein [Latilactobacillus curvatus]|uniref:HK97-gp10 family putative phage morphogenesis protein n=1 Tax=Latilactobacillus curvatus TaxID=28038 RepID=UPI0020C7B271|nr:HK97-gp10 family putative phage morphogenesis protein [Latilactobacillus curvatus]MCP8859440.1 head-tail adaptor protein [Latilactobacillus curvatus]